MPKKTLIVAAVLTLLAACDKPAEPRADRAAPPSRTDSTAASGASQSSSAPNTPANLGQPATQEEKREGANPQQQQVDPKERAQHRDFQQSGDAKGPTSQETQPRPSTGR